MDYKMIGIIGLGIFGRALVKELTRYNTEVIGLDKNQDNIDECKNYLQEAVRSDRIDSGFLKEVDFQNVDIAVVGSGMSLEETVLNLEYCQQIEVKTLYAIANTSIEEKILYKVGADYVVLPEVEMGQATARKLMRSFVNEMVEIRKDTLIAEFIVPDEWVGQSLTDLDIYNKYHVSIIGREDKDKDFQLNIDGQQKLYEETRLLGIAKRDHFDRFAEKTSLGYDLRLDD
ncbi:MAG: TrkA family potassium uptake protein [Alkalibacterium sp.]|nr:TrkA family potassium uptake protein [Alkalibacterium sp.]TVP93295.1 MAG: TrkA family potassium uptake protein [Alkalibacterium sp.]